MGLSLKEYSPSITTKDGVYYIDVPILSICFALAPKGVEIPEPKGRNDDESVSAE